jgi:hypothetical protein
MGAARPPVDGPTREANPPELSESGIVAPQTPLALGLFSFWVWNIDSVQRVEESVLSRGGDLVRGVIFDEKLAEARTMDAERGELAAGGGGAWRRGETRRTDGGPAT